MAILRITVDGGATWTPLTVGRMGPQGPRGEPGPEGPPGSSVQINGTVTNSSNLPQGVALSSGYIANDTGHLWVKTDQPNTWQDVGLIRGPQGLPGEITQATADVRYVLASGGTLTNGKMSQTLKVKAPMGNQGMLVTVPATTRPVVISAVAADDAAYDNTISFNATDLIWEIGSLRTGPTRVESLAVTGKATSSNTVLGDPEETLTTKKYVDALMPPGAIIAYGGTNSAPTGWALCNGAPHGSQALTDLLGSPNAPDLRDRFIVAAGGAYQRGATGGANRVRLSARESGLRLHKHSGNANEGGNHNHGGATGEAYVPGLLSWDQKNYYTGGGIYTAVRAIGDRNGNHAHYIPDSGNHGHGLTIDDVPEAAAIDDHENRPPYYALVYIIKK